MKRICVICGEMKDEVEFDLWFKAIGIRRYECRECNRKATIRWWLKELEKTKRKRSQEKEITYSHK